MHLSLEVAFIGGLYGTEVPIRGINLPKYYVNKKSGIEYLMCETL